MDSLSTPARPISSEQFQTLKQRVLKESPRLYTNKVLSDPRQRSNLPLKNNSVTQQELLLNEDEILGREWQDGERALKKNEELREDLGNFENPVLEKLAKRTVNREYETHTIVVNLIALAIWDLLVKFFKLFIDYTKYGEKLINYLQDELINKHIVAWRRCVQTNFPFVLSWLTWSNIDTLLHIIVVYNIIVSLWRLFSKVKVDDLNLTQSQKKLLGLDTQGNAENAQRNTMIPRPSTITKPHVILDQRHSSSSNTGVMSTTISGTPYLFKSLETPLKKKQKDQQMAQTKQQPQNINLHRHAQSAFVSKVNAFGSLKNNLVNTGNLDDVQTPEGRTGYIPSNKYAYMVNSPCPRKKM